MKRCPRCGIDKPLTEQYWNHARSLKTGWGGWCKTCNREYMTSARRKVSALKTRCPMCGAWFVGEASCCSPACLAAFERHLADVITAERQTLDPICRCGAKLWGETDYLGNAGDWCPSCGYRKLIERRVAIG